jgi:hypothetical protein
VLSEATNILNAVPFDSPIDIKTAIH